MKNEKNNFDNKKVFLIICLVGLVIIVNNVRMHIINTAVGQGKKAYDQDDYDLAIRSYTRANKLIIWEREEKADNLLWRGRAYYYGKHDFDMAIADFTEAIKLSPNYVAYYLWRGRAYQKKGEWDSAIADFTKAIELDSNNSYGGHKKYIEHGDVYYEKGDYDRSILDYNLAIAEIDVTIAKRSQYRIEYPEYDWDNNELDQQRDEVIAQRNRIERRLNNPIGEIKHD